MVGQLEDVPRRRVEPEHASERCGRNDDAMTDPDGWDLSTPHAFIRRRSGDAEGTGSILDSRRRTLSRAG